MDEIKILTSDAKVGRDEEGRVTDAITEVKAMFRGDNLIGIGESFVHPDDRDLATDAVGMRIGYLRGVLHLHDIILEKYELSDEDVKTLTESRADLDQSIKEYIQGKELFYQKIRINRDPEEKAKNQIRTVHIDKDGKVEEV